MTVGDKDSDRQLRRLLYQILIPRGYRPRSDQEIDAMLDTIGGEPLSEEKKARMLRKIQSGEGIGVRDKVLSDVVYADFETLSEEQKELVSLCRAKGEEIPPEIQAILDEMEKRAGEPEEEKDET